MRLAGLIREYWSPLLQAMALGLVVAILGLVPPYLSKVLIDQVHPARDVTLMHAVVLALLAVTAGQTLLGSFRSYFSQYTANHLGSATTLMFFNHLQHLPLRFFDRHRVGEVMSRFSDVRNSLSAVSRILETLIISSVYLLIVPPILFILHWKLALVALITLPITLLITVYSARAMQRYTKESAEQNAEVSASHVEVLSQIRTLKSLAMEHRVFEDVGRQTRTALRAQLRARAFGACVGAATGSIRGIGLALFTWYGWTLILGQELTLGAYIAFAAYIGYLYSPLNQIVHTVGDFQQSAVFLARMFEYLDLPTERDPAASYSAPPPIGRIFRGEVALSDVAFAYTPGDYVLQQIDLRFPAGQMTAIVGPSGAGKSTLLRILAGLERPERGEVYYDGVPAASIPLQDIRRQVSAAWQDFSLLDGTIWENLTLGTEETSRDRVIEAVRLCRLEELISSLPNGYATPVGEWGATLSGGQRQRIALARALIRNAPILLLDEATSNLDLEQEWAILQGLAAFVRDRTMVFVSHRAAVSAMADRVVIMSEGRAVATGTHEDLTRSSEFYRRLLRSGTQRSPDRPLLLEMVQRNE